MLKLMMPALILLLLFAGNSALAALPTITNERDSSRKVDLQLPPDMNVKTLQLPHLSYRAEQTPDFRLVTEIALPRISIIENTWHKEVVRSLTLPSMPEQVSDPFSSKALAWSATASLPQLSLSMVNTVSAYTLKLDRALPMIPIQSLSWSKHGSAQ